MYISRRDKARIFVTVLVVALFCGLVFNTAKAQSASLFFNPATGRHVVGDTFSVEVRLNTGGVAINAAEGTVLFEQSKMRVISVSKAGSIFNLWTTEPKFDNANGTVDFGGGLPDPGYTGNSGLIITIYFKAIGATTEKGYSDTVLVSGAVLANDGQGTNILATLGKNTQYISSAETGALPTATPQQPIVAATIQPHLKSSTHPDQNKWYAVKTATIQWDVPPEAKEVRLALSRQATELPHVRYLTPISEKILPDLEDGVWYLNAQFVTARGISPISSFKLQIDTVAPRDFQIKRVDTNDENARPELLFTTTDDLSGIDHYEMKIGTGEWFNIEKLPDGQSYRLPELKAGTYTVSVKAVDGAGNSTSATPISISVVQRINPTLLNVVTFLSKLFDDVVNVVSKSALFIAFVAVLVGLLISLIKLFEAKIKKWWHAATQKRVLKSTEKKSVKKLDHIVKDMKEELKFLESIGHRRRLNPEEKYLKAKLEQYLKMLKILEK